MNRIQRRQAARKKPRQLSIVTRRTAQNLGYLSKRGLIQLGGVRHALVHGGDIK